VFYIGEYVNQADIVWSKLLNGIYKYNNKQQNITKITLGYSISTSI